MAKYRIKNTTLLHDGKTRYEGEIIELTDEQAKKLADYIEKVKDTEVSNTSGGSDTSNTQEDTGGQTQAQNQSSNQTQNEPINQPQSQPQNQTSNQTDNTASDNGNTTQSDAQSGSKKITGQSENVYGFASLRRTQ